MDFHVSGALRFPAVAAWLAISLSALAQQGNGNGPGRANPPLKEKLKAPHHPGRLIVKFKENVDAGSQEAAHGRAATRPHRKLKKLHSIEVRNLNGRKNLEETISTYEATGLVEYAEPDYQLQADPAPNDPLFARSELWHQNNTGQGGGKADADIDAPEAWETRTIATTPVAVIDTGVRYTHEDLAANMWRNPGEVPGNRVDDDGNGYVDDVFGIDAITGSGNPMDDNGHGTHVAGSIAAAGNNGKGVAGVAWAARIMACRFMDRSGSGYTSDAIECINYARARGARILNNSWGGAGYSQALFDALNRCRTAGAIIVAAAGNDASNNDAVPNYPAGYPLDNIISVAATTRADTLAAYSNFGPNTVEIAAPGDQIVSTFHQSNASYAELSGTSMAAPQVAGLLALLRSQFPSDTYQQLLTRVLQTADPVPALAGRTRTGARINLQKALTTASQPANDAFAAAASVVGDSFKVTGPSGSATKEPGEPQHAGKPGGSSIWWKWTPVAGGPVRASTAGSKFNTLLAVHTGTAVDALTPIASNDNARNVTTSALTFTAVAGEAYFFAVDGVNGAAGQVVLTVNGPASGEPNNPFAGRVRLSGKTISAAGSSHSANKEAREPNHVGTAGGKSVWWTWTAPVSGYFTLETTGSSFDTLLGVYTGTKLGALKPVAGNDDAGPDVTQSRVRFYAVAGRGYQIAVDGFDAVSGEIQLAGSYR